MKYYRVLLQNAVTTQGKDTKIFFNPENGLLFYQFEHKFKHITSLIEWDILIDSEFSEEITLNGIQEKKR